MKALSFTCAVLPTPLDRAAKGTLTVMGLSELVNDIRLKVAVQTKADIAKDRCDFAREWRNKKLAHTDLEMLRTGDASSLPAVNTTNIEYGIGAIKDVLTHIADHYDQPRLISISNPWGSKSLVSYLEHIKKLRDMEEASWKDV